MPKKAEWRVGTSGWSYEHWQGLFYPEDIPKSRWFEYYTENFDTVEINYTFYSMPKEKTLRKWYDNTPEDFCFILKMNRFVTHRKKLDNVEKESRKFFDLARILDEKLGVILHQLPPSMKFEKSFHIIRKYAGLLPSDIRHAIEFRHDSWLREEVFDVLRENGIAYCIISAPELKHRIETTAPFSYIRFHGTSDWYSHDYSDKELNRWAQEIRKLIRKGICGYVYFNNDFEACAVRNAIYLRSKL